MHRRQARNLWSALWSSISINISHLLKWPPSIASKNHFLHAQKQVPLSFGGQVSYFWLHVVPPTVSWSPQCSQQFDSSGKYAKNIYRKDSQDYLMWTTCQREHITYPQPSPNFLYIFSIPSIPYTTLAPSRRFVGTLPNSSPFKSLKGFCLEASDPLRYESFRLQ